MKINLHRLTDHQLSRLYGEVICEIADRNEATDEQTMYALAYSFWNDHDTVDVEPYDDDTP